MVSYIEKHEKATDLLRFADFEKSIFWTDEDTGLQFKSRPDAWKSKMIIDVKTVCDASPHALASAALKQGYYLQAGMAYEACNAIGKPIDIFVILACEKEAPFAPSIFILDDKALKFGIEQFNTLKMRLKDSMNTNVWPAYDVQELSVPQYAISNEGE